MIESITRSAPPPAQNIAILAADLLARRATTLLSQLAYAGNWKPADDLKQALETYADVRANGVIATAQAAPTFVNCERCRMAGVCLTPGEANCAEFDPLTQRSAQLEAR